MRSPKNLAEHYDRQAACYGKDFRSCHYRFRSSFMQRQKCLIQLLGKAKGQKFLDLGCGPGLLTAFLAGSNQIVGLDLSIEMLKLARQELKPVLGRGQGLPFKNETFDTVLALETLQHIPPSGVAVFLSESSRVIRKEGRLILSAIHKDSLLHKLFSNFGGYDGLYFHSLKGIGLHLEKEGLVMEQTKFLGFPLPWIWTNNGNTSGFASSLATSWMMQWIKKN